MCFFQIRLYTLHNLKKIKTREFLAFRTRPFSFWGILSGQQKQPVGLGKLHKVTKNEYDGKNGHRKIRLEAIHDTSQKESRLIF